MPSVVAAELAVGTSDCGDKNMRVLAVSWASAPPAAMTARRRTGGNERRNGLWFSPLRIAKAGGLGDLTGANGIPALDTINGGTTVAGTFAHAGSVIAGQFE